MEQSNARNEFLTQAAAGLAAGRTLGLTDDEAISIRNLTLQREQQKQRAAEMAQFRALTDEQKAAVIQEVEAKIATEGIPSMDESDLKSDSQVMRDEGENFGYSDYRQFEQAQTEEKEVNRLYENLAIKKEQLQREKRRNPTSQKASRLAQELQVLEDQAKNFGFGMMDFAQEGEATGDERQAQLDGERSRQVRRGDSTFTEDLQGGTFNRDNQVIAQPGMLGNPDLAPFVNRRNQRQKLQELIAGRAAVADANRRFRGDLTDIEIEGQARRAAMAMENPDAPFKLSLIHI